MVSSVSIVAMRRRGVLQRGQTVSASALAVAEGRLRPVRAARGDMKLRALVRDPEGIERFLRHENLWSPPPTLSPAQAPPYDRSVTRLQPTRQQDLFPEA
jgi:hypothetical protein